ncbi:Zn(II)2Cys6 transcription factor [Aspergillus lucknowensis]|uniref:Fungal-specific transcription factor domain-containing protein n=1 Tax=Aspergillus lucknowensis TaxID=176173 RepID=A0ABR4LMD2_9EURO
MIEPCYTCRRRHIQCDRSQVPCAKCQKAGLQCLDKRPIRWVQGVAIRGGMRGRRYENASVSSAPVLKTEMHAIPPNELQPKTNAQPQLLVPLNAPSSGLQTHSNIASEAPFLAGVPLAMNDSALVGLDSASRYYLEYYNDRICQLFIVYDSQANPFRSLIPLALTDTVLLDSVLALAARHRANFDHPFSANGVKEPPASEGPLREALRFKHRAIQGLAHTLNRQNSYQDATMASIFLLVFLDLLESGCDRWNYHLEGAKTLMTLTPTEDPGLTLQRIRQFIAKQIHLIEALGATFVRPHLLSQSDSIDSSTNLLEDVVEESFLGCPEFILTSLQFLSIQRDILANGSPSEQPSTDDIVSVIDGVKEFDCYLWALSLRRESVTRNIGDLCRLARAYQLGAILYGQRVLDALQNTWNPQNSVVSELVELINTLKDGSSLLKCILWPITVAGLECQIESQRDLLTRALERFWMDTHCLNVMNAARILKAHWTKVDENKTVASQWIFDIGRLSHDWLLI